MDDRTTCRPLGLVFALSVVYSCTLLLGVNGELLRPTRPSNRQNTTAHFIFNTVSGLLQHWPNTIYRNGHTFVPAYIPAGTLLYHGRTDYHPPPSPEYFAFDFDHAYLFSFGEPCVVFTYATKHDLRVGYFDGTGAAQLRGPRDFQDILFNDGFVPPEKYNPWIHAQSMCVWAREVGLDGIVRMEPNFETILCNINADLELVTRLELVHPEIPILAYPPGPPEANASYTPEELKLAYPRLRFYQPVFPEPTIPALPPPIGWVGKQLSPADVMLESIRSGMWHNFWPGEARVQLDYSSIISAYDEQYLSLVNGRRGLPRIQHRLGGISPQDKRRLQSEVRDVLSRERVPSTVNWPTLFQGVIDRHAGRLEDLRYVLRHSKLPPPETVAIARQKVLIMLMPFMVLPRIRVASTPGVRTPSDQDSDSQVLLTQARPEDDWISRIYQACAVSATAGILRRDNLTKQEKLLAKSIDSVQGEICSSLTSIWSTAFDSGNKPVFAQARISEWRAEIEELMEWLDWHVWLKCEPPCAPGLSCILTTWPWEVRTDEQPVVPTCRDRVLAV